MTDIETALAEALQLIAKYEHGSPWEWWTPREDCVGSSAEFAAAILATEPMQAIARQAAIGAAVERMFDKAGDGFDFISITKHADRMSDGYEPDPRHRWTIESGLTTLGGDGPTLPEAVAAALEDDHMCGLECSDTVIEADDLRGQR